MQNVTATPNHIPASVAVRRPRVPGLRKGNPLSMSVLPAVVAPAPQLLNCPPVMGTRNSVRSSGSSSNRPCTPAPGGWQDFEAVE